MQKRKERTESLFRIVVAIVTGVVVYFWGYLAMLLIVINWLATLITGTRNREVAEFIEYWTTTTYQLWRYLSGMTNKRPFPFTKLERMSKFERH